MSQTCLIGLCLVNMLANLFEGFLHLKENCPLVELDIIISHPYIAELLMNHF